MPAAKKRRRRSSSSEEINFRHLYRQYKRSALKRSLKFRLTPKRFRELSKSNCLFCGSPPTRSHKMSTKYKTGYVFNGIDRLDNKVGYIDGNCAPCCWQCNLSKASHSLEDFLLYINRIYNHVVKPALNEGLPTDEQEQPDDY